ncbi:Wzz/FepE/Etk N-terminal domain-containing protein [Micromonospora saelicesensis]|uniref:Wzz/FepE/Etk N-terminal domain-containing protein n=1 Tax=Micromonospora saelicesensis TaxID=285676 RepID=UPI0035A2416A
MRLSGGFLPAGAPSPPSDTSRHTTGFRGVVNRTRSSVSQWTQLTPRHHLQALRTYRWAVLALVLLGGAGGGLASLLQTPTYKASAQLFFSPNFPTTDIGQLDAGGNYILQRVRSYTEIANSPGVAATVIDRLDLPYTPEQLMLRISVTGKASTAVLNVEVSDPSPERARDIANAIAEEFPAFIGQLEKPAGINTTPVKVSIVRPATAPSSPDSPQPLNNVGLGLAGGLLVGAITAITGYARERAVRDEHHAVEVAGLSLLGVVKVNTETPVLIADNEQSVRTETFRQMRANVRLQAVGERLTSITVTGCSAGDGRAATAANLAIAFARAGETVVLVDGNLRNPEVHELLGISNEAGLANILRGEASVNDAVVRWRQDLPLYVLPTGRVAPGPSERLFRPDGLAKVTEALRRGQAFVIVNGPPLLSDAEATFLITATDATVVVARVGVTHTEQLAATVGVLREMRANLLGLIAVRSTKK